MAEVTTKPLTDNEDIDDAWHKLWSFANSAITEGENCIYIEDFISSGKKLFDVKSKQYIAATCNQDS